MATLFSLGVVVFDVGVIAITGEGYEQLAIDSGALAVDVGLLLIPGDPSGAGVLTTGARMGLWGRRALRTADVGINAYQTYEAGAASRQAFQQGNQLGGYLNLGSALLGGAGVGLRGAQSLRALDNHFEIVSNGGVFVNAGGLASPLRIIRRDARVTSLMEAGIPGARRLRAGSSGGNFQIDRAYHYFTQGRLSRIEHAVGMPRANRGQRPRVDLRLTDGTRVELKSWTGWDYSHPMARRGQLKHLQEQVPIYLGGRGTHLRVEFDGIVPDPARLLLERFQRTYGDRLWFGAV